MALSLYDIIDKQDQIEKLEIEVKVLSKTPDRTGYKSMIEVLKESIERNKKKLDEMNKEYHKQKNQLKD